MGKRFRRERARLEELRAEVEAAGYSLHFVEWCEDPETPGFLGQLAGVTDHERRKVKIRQHGPARKIVAILEHELEHVSGVFVGKACPEFGLRCGNEGRDPRPVTS